MNTPTKADKKFLALFILVLVLIIGFIAVYTMNFLKEEQEFQRIKAEAATICENAGFTDVIAHVEGPEKGYGYETYTLTVTYKGTEKIGSGKLRNILEALKKIDTTLKYSILMSRFRMGGEPKPIAGIMPTAGPKPLPPSPIRTGRATFPAFRSSNTMPKR
ncbi:MAG: hypothetical protein PUE84_01055 [Firmicutes bacterium]|nr:hypothetical protein [Bacillota bacterium]